MKNFNAVNKREGFDVKLKLPKDLHFKVLGKLVDDLSCDVDMSNDNPTIICEFVTTLRGIIRARDVGSLMKFTSLWSTQRILSSVKNRGDFFLLYQLTSFLRKFPFKGVDTREAAIINFEKYERTCFLFNTQNKKAILALNKKHPDYYDIITEIQEDILQLLGEDPPMDTIFGLASHGPGTSVLSEQHGKGKSTEFYKWSTLPYSVTEEAMPLMKQAILSDPRWIGALDEWYRRVKLKGQYFAPISLPDLWASVFCIVNHSRLTTVPKSAETDRTICIEPSSNVFLQLGVDGFIRGRLKSRWGIDLDDQSKNQSLAYEGSVSDDKVTLDLRGASDTVTTTGCEMLLPVAWYDLLSTLRCRFCLDEKTGKLYELSKISSMGNGYTFALESLLFAALVRVSMRRTKSVGSTSVYGDDLIVPTSCYSYLKELLSLFGFSLNVDKSFHEGPFRESCGKDFYKGSDVRPVFLKKQLRTITDLFFLHNSLYNLETEKGELFISTSRTRALILRYLPKNIGPTFFGPPSENLDSHIFSLNRCYLFRSTSKNHKYRGHWCHHVLRVKPQTWKWRYKDYHFIKLMVSLRGERPLNKWDWRTHVSGNAFEITRRDRTDIFVRESIVY